MSWLDDIIKGSVLKAFDDPVIKKKGVEAILNVLKDKAVLSVLNGIIAQWFKDNQSIPVPGPPPTPPPIPPPPVSTSITLFDLGDVWKVMQKEGFPGREGVLLYALGQVARGYKIPIQSEELELIDSYYSRIKTWYDTQVNEAKGKLEKDQGLPLVVIDNDAKDRFGFRLGPPTYELLQGFGDRVTLGIIFPEDQYT